jgi:hypothetical protein
MNVPATTVIGIALVMGFVGLAHQTPRARHEATVDRPTLRYVPPPAFDGDELERAGSRRGFIMRTGGRWIAPSVPPWFSPTLPLPPFPPPRAVPFKIRPLDHGFCHRVQLPGGGADMTVATDIMQHLDENWISARGLAWTIGSWSHTSVKSQLDRMHRAGKIECKSVPIPGVIPL